MYNSCSVFISINQKQHTLCDKCATQKHEVFGTIVLEINFN